MKAPIFILLMFCPFLIFSQFNYKNLDVKTDTTDAGLRTYTYQNMRIYPIYARQSFINYNQNTGRYTPLNDAIARQMVKISETSDDGRGGATVNTLYIQNTSADTVYIMGGEVVKGGKQDRVISQDVILPPKSGKIDLSVYCVEHGRWTYNSPTGQTSFNSVAGVASPKVLKAAKVERDQSKVWEEVQDVTAKNKTQTSTGTYTALTSSKDYNENVAKYVAFFEAQLAKEKNVIGFLAATGDSIMGCDMFATSVLFNQHLSNLLKSYATEAITNGKPVKIKSAVVKTYLDKLLLNEQDRAKNIKSNGQEFKLQQKTLHIATY